MKFALKYPRLLLHKRAIAFDRAMLSLLVVAFIIRVTAVITFPSLAHPDENFQLFEQGHRFAFGYGVVSWEWSAGIRSPVLPFLLSCIFRVAEPLVGGPEGYLVVAKLVLVLSSLSAVAAVYRMGQRTGPTHALIAGLVAATWFELIYFAGRPLTEAVATTVLLVGLSLASVSENHLTQRRLLAIGLCFGLCLMLRVQLVAGLLGRRALDRTLPLARTLVAYDIGQPSSNWCVRDSRLYRLGYAVPFLYRKRSNQLDPGKGIRVRYQAGWLVLGTSRS